MANPLLYTLHIQLEPLQINPPIWRRLRVAGDCSLRKLHHYIQAAFGWHSEHLHEFEQDNALYTRPESELAPVPSGTHDDRKVKLRQVLADTDQRLRYLYDFGDSWQHVIAVERIEPFASRGSWCEVIGGARACPPENVGGVKGYAEFLQGLALSGADNGDLAGQWPGNGFDPDLFDLRAAHAAVQRLSNNFWG
ncbi:MULTISPECIES: plasmid pRiA4b ORF-3 family protein [unclassified Pseudomonas]|uniref:plasmid pRiA4b ORF-3 family protein n=1 Tax=unclassified Pseudomonas TaxID=196821 RepID=UPI000BDA87BD|nr:MULTISPECIES: plasmid pRiA4b ORF-3 family protein [unclassified Pseudomonas]PVZ20068.1 pRiA4b ORF-3-like protein [Pseudomonas sp. URIL14HWK12:I12]PVZ27134.1 pRiA4b ORF-3-like protein [Pseudomonas sp. URIL14HWK12:I10]PVZ38023.1 pRiA4b ORF-3-like protein [Pseudomonas sp. URIL14HWK12:I11]SNZ04789.1 pRiA4b ORF-3-like protein [Pseudomonas sp. URIL14HWK12:I9]